MHLTLDDIFVDILTLIISFSFSFIFHLSPSSIQGIICAIPLVFILPTACYIRLAEGTWYAKHKIPSLLIGALGILVTVFGFVTLFVDTSLSKCQDPGALPYCLKDQQIVNASVLQPPTESPFVPMTTPVV